MSVFSFSLLFPSFNSIIHFYFTAPISAPAGDSSSTRSVRAGVFQKPQLKTKRKFIEKEKDIHIYFFFRSFFSLPERHHQLE